MSQQTGAGQTVRPMAAAVLIATMSTAGAAQADVTLKLTNVFADTHFTNVEGIKPFIEAVEAATGGKVKFELFPGAQLGKNASELIGQGLAEGGLVVPSYEPDKMPLTSVGELPAMHMTSCEGARKIWAMVQVGGPVYEAEYKPLGLHPIYAYNLQPYEVHTTEVKVTTLDDLKGLKLRANGAAQDKTIRALGGVPVRVTGPELFDSLSRGTVDGGMWLAFASKGYSLEKVLKYAVKGTALGAGGVNIFAVSDSVWDELDDATRKILMDAGQAASQRVCTFLDDGDASSTKDLVDNFGFEVTTLTEAENARWRDAVSSVAAEWATEMDASGRPGTAILEAYKKLD